MTTGESKEEPPAYPTDAANRAKAKRQEREAAILEAGGTQEDVKQSRKRKAQSQQQHFDDCSSDVDILQDASERVGLALQYPTSYSFWESTPLRSVSSDRFVNLDTQPPEIDHAEDLDVVAFFARHTHRRLDVIEICGGVGGVSKVSLRQHLKVGKNFDLTCGIDLTDPKHVAALWKYIREVRPRFIIMAPPCTAFASWSHHNRTQYPEAWRKSRLMGMAIGKLCADVALWQIAHGGYYVIENPFGSELFTQSYMNTLRQSHSVHEVHFPQCALGLKSPEGDPILKRTTFWTNSYEVVRAFQGLRCVHQPWEHGELAGLPHEQQVGDRFDARPRMRIHTTLLEALIRMTANRPQALDLVLPDALHSLQVEPLAPS